MRSTERSAVAGRRGGAALTCAISSGRLAWAVVILLGTTWITFAIVFVVPGDPARVVAGPRADAATLATIRHELGLDRSLPVQYGHYVWRLAHGDLGRSYATRQPVATTLRAPPARDGDARRARASRSPS